MTDRERNVKEAVALLDLDHSRGEWVNPRWVDGQFFADYCGGTVCLCLTCTASFNRATELLREVGL